MKTSVIIKLLLATWFVLFAYNSVSSDIAEKVIAEEITGVVVDKASGRPIADAVVAIRFERHNTGHGSVACFRSMAAMTDANGRFRFEPWTQQDTLANTFLGEVIAYKQGYQIPRQNPEYIRHASRTLLGFRYSKNLNVPKTEVRLELSQWGGTDEDRMLWLRKTAGDFSCYGMPRAERLMLVSRLRDEVLASPAANNKVSQFTTNKSWFDNRIKEMETQ